MTKKSINGGIDELGVTKEVVEKRSLFTGIGVKSRTKTVKFMFGTVKVRD